MTAMLAALCACSDTKTAPKGIDADGTVYVACKGLVTISGNLQQGYEVRFTDAFGMEHDVRGIHKLEVVDLPDTKSACPDTKAGTASTGSNADPKGDAVSDACKQARANGTNMKWNDEKKMYEVNPACEQ